MESQFDFTPKEIEEARSVVGNCYPLLERKRDNIWKEQIKKQEDNLIKASKVHKESVDLKRYMKEKKNDLAFDSLL